MFNRSIIIPTFFFPQSFPLSKIKWEVEYISQSKHDLFVSPGCALMLLKVLDLDDSSQEMFVIKMHAIFLACTIPIAINKRRVFYWFLLHKCFPAVFCSRFLQQTPTKKQIKMLLATPCMDKELGVSSASMRTQVRSVQTEDWTVRNDQRGAFLFLQQMRVERD